MAYLLQMKRRLFAGLTINSFLLALTSLFDLVAALISYPAG